MPRLEPVQFSKLNAAGLISPSAVGTARIGAGAIQTPRAADALQAPFVRQNAELPIDLGGRIANIAEAIQATALKRAAAEGKAQGGHAAIQLYEQMSTAYYGAEVGDFGISGLKGSEFLAGSRMWEQEYKTQRDLIARSLESYAAAEFISETEKYRQSMLGDVRKTQAEQLDVFHKQTNAGLALATAHLLAQEYTVDTEKFTTGAAYELMRRLEADGHPYSIVETETGEVHKVYPEELRAQYMGRMIVDVAEALALRPEGSAKLLEFVNEVQVLVVDPVLLKRLQDLPGELVDEEIQNLKRDIEREEVLNNTAIRAQYRNILTTWNSLTDAGVRKEFKNSLYLESPEHYKALKSIFVDANYEPTPADHDFLAFALKTNMLPSEAAVAASNRSVHITTAGFQQLISNNVATGAQERATYSDRLETEFGRVLQNLAGPDNVMATFAASLFGQGEDKFYIDTLKIRWNDVATRAIKAEIPLNEAYAKFVTDNLNPAILNDELLKPDINRSTLPQSLSLQRVVAKGNTDMFSSYIAFTATIIAHARTNLDTPYDVNDSLVSHGDNLMRLAKFVDAQAKSAISGNPVYQEAAALFWETYIDAQKVELRNNNMMSYTPADWHASTILESISARQRLEVELDKTNKTVLQNQADAQAKAAEEAKAAGKISILGTAFQQFGKTLETLKDPQ